MGFSREGLVKRLYAAIALLLSILQLPTFARTATTPRSNSSSPASAAEPWQITDGEETALLPAAYQTYTTAPVDSAKTGSSNKAEGHGGEIAHTEVAAALHGSPVMFIENVGQFAESARFQERGGDRTIWLAEDGLWVTVLEKPSSPQPPSPNLREGEAILPSPKFGREAGGEGQTHKGVNLRLIFPGANPHPRLDTHVSYFFGNDPEQWHADVPVWGGVRYVDLYPGVDLEITGDGGRWTWQLVLRTPSPWQGEGWS